MSGNDRRSMINGVLRAIEHVFVAIGSGINAARGGGNKVYHDNLERLAEAPESSRTGMPGAELSGEAQREAARCLRDDASVRNAKGGH